jgi:hypothetical protein
MPLGSMKRYLDTRWLLDLHSRVHHPFFLTDTTIALVDLFFHLMSVCL